MEQPINEITLVSSKMVGELYIYTTKVNSAKLTITNIQNMLVQPELADNASEFSLVVSTKEYNDVTVRLEMLGKSLDQLIYKANKEVNEAIEDFEDQIQVPILIDIIKPDSLPNVLLKITRTDESIEYLQIHNLIYNYLNKIIKSDFSVQSTQIMLAPMQYQDDILDIADAIKPIVDLLNIDLQKL